jgi:preprotein translocase subunit SecB
MAEANLDPVFQIQRVYLKDISLEQPNSPAILLDPEQPSVDIQLGVETSPVADGLFEVTVTATVHGVFGGSQASRHF